MSFVGGGEGGVPVPKRILGANRPVEVHLIHSHVLRGTPPNYPGHRRDLPIFETFMGDPEPLVGPGALLPVLFLHGFNLIFVDSPRNETSLHLLQ